MNNKFTQTWVGKWGGRKTGRDRVYEEGVHFEMWAVGGGCLDKVGRSGEVQIDNKVLSTFNLHRTFLVFLLHRAH